MANSGAPARVLVIDNIDSFVYNLVQYVGELGAEPIVVRNNEITVEEALALAPNGVLLSPGPGRPDRGPSGCRPLDPPAAATAPGTGRAAGPAMMGAEPLTPWLPISSIPPPVLA